MKTLVIFLFGLTLANSVKAQNGCVDFLSFGPNYCDTIYTQNVYPVENSGCLNANEAGIYSGIGNNTFGFDGSSQQITFIGYGFANQFDQLGYSVNSSSVFYLDAVFPMTVNGVHVVLDMNYPEPTINPSGWEYYSITFTGNISQIVHESFESGITNVCWEAVLNEGCIDFLSFGPNYCNTVFTQNIYPVLTSGCLNDNQLGIYSGVGNDTLNFDGSNQQITVIGYGLANQFDQVGYSINNGSVFYLNATFPMTVGGIQVTFDINYPEPSNNPLGWEYYSITFTGNISEMIHESFESGITNVCWESTASILTNSKNEDISVFPNPVTNNLTIQGALQLDEVIILNLLGETLFISERLSGVQVFSADLSGLKSGSYIVMMISDNKKYQRSFVKM